MNNKLKGCFSHETDHWQTPKYMYWIYVEKCKYYDPCPYKCTEFDGLKVDWQKNVFCNPPYSEIEKWVEKAIKEHQRHYDSHIVMLLPVKTDTKWFKKLEAHASKIVFIHGRLHFNESKQGAPFPSMLVELYYGKGEGSTTCYVQEQDRLKEWYKEEVCEE